MIIDGIASGFGRQSEYNLNRWFLVRRLSRLNRLAHVCDVYYSSTIFTTQQFEQFSVIASSRVLLDVYRSIRCQSEYVLAKTSMPVT